MHAVIRQDVAEFIARISSITGKMLNQGFYVGVRLPACLTGCCGGFPDDRSIVSSQAAPAGRKAAERTPAMHHRLWSICLYGLSLIAREKRRAPQLSLA